MLVGIMLGLDREGAFITWLILGILGISPLSCTIMLCFNASSREGGGSRSMLLCLLRSPGAMIWLVDMLLRYSLLISCASSSVYKFKKGFDMNYLVPKSGGNLVFLNTAWLMENEYSDTDAIDTLSFSPSYYLISRFLRPKLSAYLSKSIFGFYTFASYATFYTYRSTLSSIFYFASEVHSM